MSARLLALRSLQQVISEGRSLDDALVPLSQADISLADKALAQAMCYGVLRDYPRLRALLALLLSKPLKAKDDDIYISLLLGLHQLDAMRVPDHAAINETVALTGTLKKKWASGLVNAILRRFQREKDRLLAQLAEDETAQYAHPQWLIDRLKQDWPQDWQAILSANNQQAPMSLRCNLAHQTRDGFLHQLQEADVSATVISATSAGIQLDTACDVVELPGFADGDVSVQDGAAQLAAELLALADEQHILDACAAPGGKTAHILESLRQHHYTQSRVVAVDQSAKRLQRVQENLQRLGLSARLASADASTLDWWDGQPFDRILLDAPCSASGVIRRHPDIKLHRQPEDVSKTSQLQAQLLDTLWQALQPGGLLLYATCSVFRAENAAQITAFLARTANAREQLIEADWGRACEHGRQILPGENGMDGFYFARISKTSD